MRQTNEPDDNHPHSGQQKPFRWLLLCFRFIGAVALLGLVVGGLVCASRFIDPATTDRVQFVTGNLVNALIFIAILGQIYIYHKQWVSMDKQVQILSIAIEPRLRITNVRIVNLKAEERPTFIIWIINEGATDAKNVKFYMRAAIGTEEQHWSREQIITIPARKEEHYWIAWSSTLGQNDIDAINSSIPVKVTGYFNIENRGQQEFCYRYYPWKNRRPRDISQFIPCDFNPGLTVPAAGHAEGGSTVVGNITTITAQQKQGQKGSDNS
jgi:hypothetical protein